MKQRCSLRTTPHYANPARQQPLQAARAHGCLDGQGPLFNSAFFPTFPRGRLTRLLEIRRFGDIFSLNRGLTLKVTILLENTLKIFVITSSIRFEVCSSPTLPSARPNTFLVYGLSGVPGTRETQASKGRVGGASWPAANSPQGTTIKWEENTGAAQLGSRVLSWAGGRMASLQDGRPTGTRGPAP